MFEKKYHVSAIGNAMLDVVCEVSDDFLKRENILKGNMSDRKWNNELKKAIVEVFQLTVKLGGTISGEHGIGYVQKEYMPLALCSANLNIQKKIKKIFDSKGILNPGKIFIE